MMKIQDWIVAHLTQLYIIVAIATTSVLVLLMFPNAERSTHYNYAVGSFWTNNDLFAPYDFTVAKEQSEIDRANASARKDAILYFTIDSAAMGASYAALERSGLSRAEKQRLTPVLEKIYKKGYLEDPQKDDGMEGHKLVILSGNVGEEHRSSDFYTRGNLYNLFAPLFANDEKAYQIERLLIDSILHYSVRYDAIKSQLELSSRLAQVASDNTLFQRGELVISKGEYIDNEKAHVLAALEEENKARYSEHFNVFNHYVGLLFLCFIAFATLFAFLAYTKSEILEDQRKITFTLVIVLLMSSITALILKINPDWVLLAPLCIAPILMNVFFDMRVALYLHLTIVIILGNMVPNSFEFTFYQLIAGMMSIITVRNFVRRSDFFVVAGVIFASYSLIYTFGKLGQDTNFQNLHFESYAIFFLNAVLTLISYPLIYLFEHLFGMTTDLTLLEISSTNTPALRALSRQAPGTFQHSMQVANISEDIINEIGGDALLARVGALYHDIGKMENPLFFTENQKNHFNPNDNLDYEESANIIIKHVQDGIMLAKKYHLPTEVTNFIRTHHGTTHTGYFFAKWREEHPNEIIDEWAFRYSGPEPFSRETAVVMMVDSVEAASHSLKTPSEESIGHLVDNIIDGKIKENQLLNCNITYGDITKLRKALKEKMMSVYHIRVAYPVVGEEEDKQE
ncbi:MAG: HDIG domain-containing protein [Bacteroidales bacterium]|nr:HDIG domain-containing protein [Bacteroidales bacterium]